MESAFIERFRKVVWSEIYWNLSASADLVVLRSQPEVEEVPVEIRMSLIMFKNKEMMAGAQISRRASKFTNKSKHVILAERK